jgi:hypothetical protein
VQALNVMNFLFQTWNRKSYPSPSLDLILKFQVDVWNKNSFTLWTCTEMREFFDRYTITAAEKSSCIIWFSN